MSEIEKLVKGNIEAGMTTESNLIKQMNSWLISWELKFSPLAMEMYKLSINGIPGLNDKLFEIENSDSWESICAEAYREGKTAQELLYEVESDYYG